MTTLILTKPNSQTLSRVSAPADVHSVGIHLSLFDCKSDNIPKPVLRTFQQICERIKRPKARAEKDGPLISPGFFDPPRRANKNVKELSALLFDIDHGAPSLEALCSSMSSLNCAYAIYSTHSHLRVTESNPKGEPRYRVLIPLKAPVSAVDYPARRNRIIEITKLPVDPAASALANMYYAPAKASIDAPYEYHIEEGEFLDLTNLALLKTEKEKQPAIPPQLNGHKVVDELLRKSFAAHNGAETFRLFEGDTSAFGGNKSKADMGLASRFAFYAGDVTTLEEMLRRSRLAREKWDEIHYGDGRTYLQGVIEKAITECPKFYSNGSDSLHEKRLSVAKPDDWEPPAKFYEFDLPEFPLDALPDRFSLFAQELARETQVPVDLPAILAVTVAAGAVAGHVRVQARRGWIEPLNIYSATVLPPANRKSACFKVTCEPLEEVEHALGVAKRDEIARAASEYRMLEERRQKLEKEAARTDNPVERHGKAEEAIAVAQQLASSKVPITPRLIVSDVTVEQLATLMTEQGGRMSMLSPEGDLFKAIAGRYSSNGSANFDLLLKGHSGDTVRVDRRGRSEHIEHPTLTIGLTVQPAVIRGLADAPSFRGEGLLARFLYSLPRSTVGRRQVAPLPCSEPIRRDFKRVITVLAEIEPLSDPDGRSVPRTLYLTADADNLLKEFELELEPKLSEDGELGMLADWAGKLAGAIVRLTAVLWLVENADELSPWPEKIGSETMRRAIMVGRYLTEHARAAFAEMGADEEVENAKRLLRWIEKGGAHSFTRRDAHQAHRSRFKTVEEIDPALDLLEAHNYIRARMDSDGDRRPGRKASQAYDVNPFLLSSDDAVITAERAAIEQEEFISR